MPSKGTAPEFAFGRFIVRPGRREFVVDGEPVSLGARAFDLLLALIDRRQRLVTKSELLGVLWPGRVVEENNLQVHVSALRKLLGPQVIATIPGRGYQFTATIDDGAALPGDQAVGGAESPPVAQLVPSSPRRSNVLASAEPLISREADVTALAQLLSAERLVTIVGMGGIGKTELARAVALLRVESHAHGVWWVDLAALTSADKIVPAIASAANLDLGNGDTVAALERSLSQRDTLLVLDNCEHLVAHVAQVVSVVLGSAPHVRVLATSQEALRVLGEHLYRLDALAVPPVGSQLAAARRFGALQLLERRVQANDQRFSLREESVAEAIDLCRHLDGIPLAIEMAAAQVPVLGIGEIRQRLGARFKLLRNPRQSVPARQQTLRATLDWTHSLLTEPERTVLRQLSVFAGSFRLDVALQVVAAADIDEWAALDALCTLADKFLVQVERVDPPRYRLLETVRIYASDQLAQRGELVDARRRHGQSMAHLAEEAERGFWVMSDAQWWARYVPDMDDAEEAFWRACERQDVDVATATGQLLARRDYLGSAAALSAMHRRAEAAFAALPAACPRAQAVVWNWMAQCWPHEACGVPRVVAARRAVLAWRQLGDQRELYVSLGRLAFESANAGDIESASKALDEAASIEYPGWSPRLRLSLAALASGVSECRGDTDAHRNDLRRELALAEQAGADHAAAFARFRLAEAASTAGDFNEAVALGYAVVAEQRTLVRQSVLHIALGNLCGALLMQGSTEAAAATALEALPIALGEWMGFLLDHVALLASRTGRCADAARMLGRADVWYKSSGITRFPNEARSALLARKAIEADLDSADRARHLAAGEQLTDAQIDALVRAVVTESRVL